MSTDTPPPTGHFDLWSWAWWVALLAAVPVQAVVIGGVMYGSVGTFRSVGAGRFAAGHTRTATPAADGRR